MAMHTLLIIGCSEVLFACTLNPFAVTCKEALKTDQYQYVRIPSYVIQVL